MTEASVLSLSGAGPDKEWVDGRYRLIELIGEGGMGRVWLAEDELLQRRVAIKEIAAPPDVTPDPGTVREARAAARLHHPNVVKIFNVVWWGGRSWIVMEYVASRSLHQVVREDGPLSHRAAARAGLQMLAALRAAHEAGVLHRDVKPHNVLVCPDGRVVLTDFGLATTDPERTTNPAMGSPYFVAPESLGIEPSGPPADLWSLGATLYAATEGRPPFARPSTTAALVAVVTDEPDRPRRTGPLVDILLDLLVKDPAARPTAADLEPRLRRIADTAIGIARPSTVISPPADGRLPTICRPTTNGRPTTDSRHATDSRAITDPTPPTGQPTTGPAPEATPVPRPHPPAPAAQAEPCPPAPAAQPEPHQPAAAAQPEPCPPTPADQADPCPPAPAAHPEPHQPAAAAQAEPCPPAPAAQPKPCPPAPAAQPDPRQSAPTPEIDPSAPAADRDPDPPLRAADADPHPSAPAAQADPRPPAGPPARGVAQPLGPRLRPPRTDGNGWRGRAAAPAPTSRNAFDR